MKGESVLEFNLYSVFKVDLFNILLVNNKC